MDALGHLVTAQRTFARERNWDQFHTPKNLAMALGGEIGELAEAVADRLDPHRHDPGADDTSLIEEIGDVTLYLLRLHDVTQTVPPSPSPVDCGRGSNDDVAMSVMRAVCALTAASGRLLELFQWTSCTATIDESIGAELPERLAAVVAQLSMLSARLGIDPIAAATTKLRKNAEKYPVAASFGSARKYTTFTTGTSGS
ncbi:MazG-like family protein [Nocardia sp. CA-151230]|uniref:MazG-like family protein n=1 Tax=Nocardia sp. CA-151230 TaxID=3239982 RepID=UPI003D8F9DCA